MSRVPYRGRGRSDVRFLVTSTVIASPLICLLAVLVLDAAPPPGQGGRAHPTPSNAVIARSAKPAEPTVTGALPVVVSASARVAVLRWHRALAPTPIQETAWSRLAPVTARILSAGCRARLAEPWARREWLAFAEGLSPRQRVVYQREIMPRIWGATHPEGCTSERLS